MNKIIKIIYISIRFLAKNFTKSNISKILIIFTVGLITRILVSFYYDVNVFREYYESISIIYYSVMAIFIVVLSELFTYFNLNIIPSFIFDYSTLISEYISRLLSNIRGIYISLKEVNKNISHLKSSDFTLKSIYSYFKQIRNIFNKDNKLTMGVSIERELLKVIKPSSPISLDKGEISNVLHKGKDEFLKPNTNYKPGQSSSQSTERSKSRETLASSSKTVPFVLRTEDINTGEVNNSSRTLEREVREQLHSSSVYSGDVPRQGNYEDFPLYDDSQGSDLATPRTMPPLFGGSNASGSVRGSTHSIASQRNSDYPAPLNIRQSNQPNIILRRNSVLPEPTFSEIGYSSSAFTKSNASINNRPYDLSANGVLANVTFSRVNPVSTIPLQNVSYNRTLPLIPTNIESANQNTSGFDDTQDPCSFNYRSRHNPDFTQVSQEVTIKKPGLRGKVKLGFKSLGSKFTNGVNKIESAYIKYETVSKRHII